VRLIKVPIVQRKLRPNGRAIRVDRGQHPLESHDAMRQTPFLKGADDRGIEVIVACRPATVLSTVDAEFGRAVASELQSHDVD
jgi:hypothetical protein